MEARILSVKPMDRTLTILMYLTSTKTRIAMRVQPIGILRLTNYGLLITGIKPAINGLAAHFSRRVYDAHWQYGHTQC